MSGARDYLRRIKEIGDPVLTARAEAIEAELPEPDPILWEGDQA